MSIIKVKHSNKGIGIDFASKADWETYHTIETKVANLASIQLINWNLDDFKLMHPNQQVQSEILDNVSIELIG